jgi:SAM-dependent methyltransferase
METRATDRLFAGSVPEIYDTYLVPLIFQPYATDIARRVAARVPLRVLELAAGTGVVTRALSSALPQESAIVATDLNQPMLDRAAKLGTARPVEWRAADAMQLPFDDASFDAVVCQFGVMFFPDKAKAHSEVRRVLRPGGFFLFNVWDRIESNELAEAVTDAMTTLFPEDPARFLARTPHGYCDFDAIRDDLGKGGFTAHARIDTVADRSKCARPDIPAIGFCQGTPLRNEILARDPDGLERATAAATAAVAARFGPGPIDARMQAHIVAIDA